MPISRKNKIDLVSEFGLACAQTLTWVGFSYGWFYPSWINLFMSDGPTNLMLFLAGIFWGFFISTATRVFEEWRKQ